MCGIVGQVNNKNKVDPHVFEKMLSSLGRRGPDQKGQYFSRNIALGQTRLSIVDLSENGRQPMFNEDKTIAIVFNGEIYNFLHVKKSLKRKHTWNSVSDTESIIHGYEEYGQEIVKRIDGMFAFGLYDQTKDLITLGRDRFGKKPLYYYLDDSTFCFASELKAIVSNPQISKKVSINYQAIEKFIFYGYIPSPETIYKNIFKLEAATTIQFDIRNWKLTNKKRYWDLGQIKTVGQLGETEIVNKIDRLLDSAVEKRLMSDVPLGLFLSGGIDSSLIAHYMSKHASNICTYTVSYKDTPEADESKHVRQVVDQYDLDYHLCEFSGKDVQATFLEIMDYLDEPLADAAVVPLYFVAKQAKKDMTVVLSGDGGDEIFGGYEKYRAQSLIERTKYLKPLAYLLGRMSISPNINKLLSGYQYQFPERQFIFGSGSFMREEAEQLFNHKLSVAEVFSEAYLAETEFEQNDIVNKSLYLDCRIQLPDWYLVKGDRACMAASVEMRNPFLDTDLAEYAFSLGGNWKIKDGVTKYLTKKLAERFYPKEFIYRPKRGFGVPLDKWIKKELKETFSYYLHQKNNVFNQKYVNKLYGDHMGGLQDNQFKLLRIFAVNYWLSQHG
ncbi:MAG: hypothetical protein ACD_61C00186G0026 [uncultured bacterium]|nr:MAG: hypothetical protein ACD_61C00186G0026 [uncultured bacterium]